MSRIQPLNEYFHSPFSPRTLVICFVVPLFIALLFKRRAKGTLPPGPLGDPIIGHLRYVPMSFPWLKFTEWYKKYGDVFYVHMCGRPMIVLSSFAAAKELMDKRGLNYSDRNRFVMQSELWVHSSTLIHVLTKLYTQDRVEKFIRVSTLRRRTPSTKGTHPTNARSTRCRNIPATHTKACGSTRDESLYLSRWFPWAYTPVSKSNHARTWSKNNTTSQLRCLYSC